MSLSRRKQVSKDDLRRLMKEQKNARTTKIDSPFANWDRILFKFPAKFLTPTESNRGHMGLKKPADTGKALPFYLKYNTLGQLYCSVCSTQVKSDILWNAHIQGRTHKQKVDILKSNPRNPQLHLQVIKRKSEIAPEHTTQPKQVKGNVPESGTAKVTSLGLAEYSSSEDEEDKGDNRVSRLPSGTTTASSHLPPDFFDSGVIPEKLADEDPITVKPTHMSEVLPEGFFDDPKQDAKARNIEYRDKMEDEWELFQKEMKEQTNVSEQIIADEDEVNTEERRIEEIDEQLVRWTKIDALGKKKDALMETKKVEEIEINSDSEADEEEYEELLDWRSKASLK